MMYHYLPPIILDTFVTQIEIKSLTIGSLYQPL